MGDNSGWAAIPNWLLRDGGVSRNAKMLYLHLSSRVDERGISFPSQARLADEMGVSIPTVKRTLRELVKVGVIEVRTVRTETGRRNHYRLLADRFGGKGRDHP